MHFVTHFIYKLSNFPSKRHSLLCYQPTFDVLVVAIAQKTSQANFISSATAVASFQWKHLLYTTLEGESIIVFFPQKLSYAKKCTFEKLKYSEGFFLSVFQGFGKCICLDFLLNEFKCAYLSFSALPFGSWNESSQSCWWIAFEFGLRPPCHGWLGTGWTTLHSMSGFGTQ